MSRSFMAWLLVCVVVAVAPLCGCQRIGKWLEGEPEINRRYRVAGELLDDEKYQEAAVAYRAWLADYHDKQNVMLPMVIYNLGESCRRMRDYEGAMDAYATLIKRFSESADADVKDLVKLAKLRVDDITPETQPAPAKPHGK
jgi:TolA-binding protein